MKRLLKFLKDKEGIEIVEWALMAALFALAAGAAAGVMAGNVGTFFTNVGTYLAGLPVP
jgi:Flp pilus assembly pilin Flp